MSDRVAISHDTKARILDAAEAIMLEKGFNGVGLNEVLKAVGVPKGSFYHWFPSKEQFGVELIRHYTAEATAYKRKWLTKTETIPNALERLIAYCEAGISDFLECDCHQICLIGKLSMEVASFSEPMRQALAEGYKDWSALYENVIRDGQKQGSIRADLEPVLAAATIGDTWFGALCRAVVLRNPEPLRQAITFMKSYLGA